MGIPGFFKWLTNNYHYPDIVVKCIEHQLYGNYCNQFFFFISVFLLDENGTYYPLDETQPNPNGTEVRFQILFLIL